MSTLDGMELFSARTPTSGGAFLLTSPAKVSRAVDCPGGWAAEVKAGGKYVVARNPSTLAGYAASRDAAFNAAQQGLDLLSIARAADLGIRDSESEHVTWWAEAGGQVLRTTHAMTISLGFSATVTVTDAAGLVKPDPPPPPVTWHESLRYFRLSQATDDLFDSYRNLYLALESILDKMAPQAVGGGGRPSEGEGTWFKRALGVAHARVGLAAFAPRGSVNPVDDLFNELYTATRTSLFHAKTSRPSLLPHVSGGGKEAVTAAVERLGSLYIRLAQEELSTRSPMSVITYEGFDMMTENLKSSIRLHATDDPDVAKAGDAGIDVINPAGGTVIALDTRHAPDLERPLVRAFLGTLKAEALGKMDRLTGVGAMVKDKLISGGLMEGILLLGGVERLECQFSIRQRSAQLPKGYFAS